MTQHDESPADLGAFFAATVDRHPNLPALEIEGRTLTYLELWQRAGELAAALSVVTDRRRVGLCADRSLASYVGYLAILRRGCTVVPLAPTSPVARTAAIAASCDLDTVVVDESTDPVVLSNLGAAGLRPLSCERTDGAHGPGVGPGGDAYIVFTSGSTGAPKGVPMPHSCVLSYLSYVIERYKVGPGARFSQLFELTFDPSVFDLFAAWGGGATVVVPSRSELGSPIEFVRRQRITHWSSVPSVAAVARQFGDLAPGSMPDLQWSIFCGEKLTWDLARAWRRAAPASVIDNTYGPTELTITCSGFRLPSDPTTWGSTSNGTVPIGPVYPELEQRIIDEYGAFASSGELIVRGPQRFAGYVNPADDEGRFMRVEAGRALPWPPERPVDAEAYYRTGDLVRAEATGLVHVGRVDRQVKVSGYRIEPGEIEHVLREALGVEDAVVVVVDDLLTAFYTGRRLSDVVVKDAVRARLPQYMVPGRVVRLDAVPLTTNGKIDYGALTASAASSASTSQGCSEVSAAETFWRSALAGMGDRPNSERSGEPGPHRQVEVRLAPGQVAAVTRFVETYERRIDLVLLGALTVLMAGYDDKLEVCFGVLLEPNEVGVASAVPLRVTLGREQTVLELLDQLDVIGAQISMHRDVELSCIESWSPLGSGFRLFDVALDLTYPDRSDGPSDQSADRSRDPVRDLDASPLTIRVVSAGRLEFVVDYDGRRLDASYATQLVRHLGQMLVQVASEPEARLDELAMARPLAALASDPAPTRVGAEPRAATDDRKAPDSRSTGIIADVWREILGVAELSVHDDFFDLGGDSVSAIRIVAAASARGLTLTPRMVFENPTVASLARLVEVTIEPGVSTPSAPVDSTSPPPAVSPAVVAQLRQQRGHVLDVLPCAPVQSGMLFHSLYEPDAGAYVNQTVMSFRGALDLTALEAAWEVVCSRHEALRSSFEWELTDEPVQVVHERTAIPFTVVEVTSPETVTQYLRADRARGFDLTCPPLMRVAVFVESRDLTRIVWSWHHVLLDGWSLSIVVDELSAAYLALRAGEQPARPPVTPYRDYVEWLVGRDMVEAERYWRSVLSDFDTPLGSATNTKAGSHQEHVCHVSPDRSAALEQFARAHQLTRNTVVQGVFAMVLAEHQGLQDICIGVTSSGRPAEVVGIESMVGMFLTTTPLRVHLAQQVTILELLAQIQADQLTTRSFEFAPLTKIQSWSPLGPGRRLFESVLVFANQPEDRGSVFGDDERRAAYTSYPLMLTVGLTEDVTLHFEYQTSRYSGDQISTLAGRFVELIDMVCTDPTSSCTLADSKAGAGLVTSAGATEVQLDASRTVVELFEDRVDADPEATATIFGDDRLTYGEVDQRAGALARQLVERGVTAGVPVGVWLPRTPDAVVAALAVLKAGGVYVPIDHNETVDRVRMTVFGVGLSLVLVQSAADGATGLDTEVLHLDSVPAPASGRDRFEPPRGAGAGDGACIVSTSGTTGPAKPVMLEHHSLSAAAVGAADAFEVVAQDRMAQLAPLSSAFSLTELFVPLTRGASIAFPAPDVTDDEFWSMCARDHVTTAFLPAARWAALTELLTASTDDSRSPHQVLPASLRAVIVTGGRVELSLARAWARLDSNRARLFTGFGASEVAGIATVVELTQAVLSGEVIPMGKCLPMSQALVLDSELNPVAPGDEGELFIAGAQVARGYVGQAGSTAAAFLDAPTAAEHRLFRTGDRAVRLPDGQLELRGRTWAWTTADGRRIEPGQVERLLLGDAGVRRCAVVASGAGESVRLEAYVVLRDGVDPSAVRERLHRLLPDHELPVSVVGVAALPLTDRGRPDRRALLRLGEAAAKNVDPSSLHRTPQEEVLAQIWERVLNLDYVSTDQSFFDLGGDSITCIRVVALALRRGLKLSPSDIFEHPTVADLANVAEPVYIGAAAPEPPGPSRPLVDADVMAEVRRRLKGNR